MQMKTDMLVGSPGKTQAPGHVTGWVQFASVRSKHALNRFYKTNVPNSWLLLLLLLLHFLLCSLLFTAPLCVSANPYKSIGPIWSTKKTFCPVAYVNKLYRNNSPLFKHSPGRVFK